ncbi:MAG: SDR family NAD(P)-dependent oxidoreductase [Chakrabartia sp.]
MRIEPYYEVRAIIMLDKPKESKAVIFGASGGIGRALAARTAASEKFEHVYGVSRRANIESDIGVCAIHADVTDGEGIQQAAQSVAGPVQRLIITTGMLHDAQQAPEKTWRDFDWDALSRSFVINAVTPAIILKHFIPLIPRKGRSEIAILSARVGSINDNKTGGWYAYRASKAALNMLIKTVSVELARTHPECICVALHPGTVDTGMSKPFQARLAPEKLFTPAFAADRLISVLEGLNSSDSGGFFAWDGTTIPY